MSVPNCSLHLVQRIIFAAESAAFLQMRRANEPAIETVGPTVISALVSPGKLPCPLGYHPRATVAAHIVKRADRLIVVTVDDNALTSNFTQEIVAGIRDLIGTPGANPRLAVEALPFITEKFWVG